MATSYFPNSDVYLNHLPPSAAHQFEVTRNVYLGILGVSSYRGLPLLFMPSSYPFLEQASIWDALIYLPKDIKIITNSFGLANLCFIVSR